MNLILPKSETPVTSQRKYWEKYERDQIVIARELDKVNGYSACIYPYHKAWTLYALGETGLNYFLTKIFDPDHLLGKAHEFLHHDYIWIICRLCHEWRTSGFKHPVWGDLSNIEVGFVGLEELKKQYEESEKIFRFEKPLDKIERQISIKRIKFLTNTEVR